MKVNAWFVALLCSLVLLASADKIDIKVDNVVTDGEDAYVCAHKKLRQTVYPIGFHTHAKASIAHHILLFACKTPNPDGESHCMMPCFSREKILYAWGLNAEPLRLPPNVSFEIGGGTEFTHIVMQVHYKKRIFSPDNSKVTIYTSSSPLPNVAGVLLMSANDGVIRRHKKAVPIGIGCKLSSNSPITPFAVRVHAHSLARTNFAYWFPRGALNKPRLVGRGSPQWPQAFYPSSLRSPMQHGDYLVGFCVYDSMKRNRDTHIGSTHKDEMCNVYIMYSRRREDPQLNSYEENLCANGISINPRKFSDLLKHIPRKAFDYLPTKLPSPKKTGLPSPTEKAEPGSQTEKAKPDSQTEKAKPDSQAEKAKPDSQTEKTKPDSQTEKAKPDSKNEKAKPDSQTEKPKPDSQTEKAKPDSQNEKAEPDSQNEKAKPDSQTEKAKPDSQNEKAEPDSQNEKAEPDSQNEKAEPGSQTEKAEPDSQTEKTEPVFPSEKPKPVVHNMELKVQARLGQVAGVAVDSLGQLFIFHRGGRKWDDNTFDLDNRFQDAEGRGPIKEDTILVVNRSSGVVLRSFGANLFFLPHGITIDSADNVWLTDVALHQVVRFDKDDFSQPALTVGRRLEPGSGKTHFCKPTDVAVMPDGSFFVADGYCNSRIAAFSPDGAFRYSWGSASGYMQIPHSLALFNNSLLCCADRERARVECFRAADGESLITVKGLAPFGDELYAVCPAPEFSRQGHAIFGVGVRMEGPPQAFLLDLKTASILTKWELPRGRPHDVAAFGSDVVVADLDAPIGVMRFQVSAAPDAAAPTAAAPDAAAPAQVLTTEASRNVSWLAAGPWKTIQANLPFVLGMVLVVPLGVIALGAIIARLHRHRLRSRSRFYKDSERGQFKALINEESESDGEMTLMDDSNLKFGAPRPSPTPRNT